MKLVEVINNSRSVIELYLDREASQVREVKCLSDNRVKEYNYPIDEFFRRREVPKSLKNKVAIAMAG